MIRDLLLRISAVTSVLSLLLLPVAAYSSRMAAPAKGSIARVVRAAAIAPSMVMTAIAVSRDPFVPLAPATKPKTQSRITVRAIALGDRPAALVDENGRTRLVELGDAIVGSRVTSIGTNQIVLADGRRLVLLAQ